MTTARDLEELIARVREELETGRRLLDVPAGALIESGRRAVVDVPATSTAARRRAVILEPGRLIEPAVDPWIERGAAARRLAAEASIDSWITAGDPDDHEAFPVRLLAVEMLIKRAGRGGNRQLLAALRACKVLFVDLHVARVEARRRTKPAVNARRDRQELTAEAIEAIRHERVPPWSWPEACRRYLRQQSKSKSKSKKGREPTQKRVENLTRSVHRARRKKIRHSQK